MQHDPSLELELIIPDAGLSATKVNPTRPLPPCPPTLLEVGSSVAESGAGSSRWVAPNSVLGRYQLLVPVASGGMAQVWAARLLGSRGFEKVVAIKTILTGHVTASLAESMLREEARLAAFIQHPNVVATLELGEEAGTLYLAMEWVDGETLRDLGVASRSSGGIPRTLAINIAAQTCKGLHAAHEAQDTRGDALGIVHRDVSPANLMITYSGTVKLADFGIAKASLAAAALTQKGVLKGKISYMSPEQFSSGPVDRRSDLFSVGVLMYRLTTGRHPFRGDTVEQMLKNICNMPVLPPSRIVADYPRELEAVVLKALARDPDKRWSTAQELFEALAAAEPDAVQGSYEARLGDFVSERLGERGKQRRNNVQQALQEIPPGLPQGMLAAHTTVTSSVGAYVPTPVSGVRPVSLAPGDSLAALPFSSASPPTLKAPEAKQPGHGARKSWEVAAGVTVLLLSAVLLSRLYPLPDPDSSVARGPAVGATALATDPSLPDAQAAGRGGTVESLELSEAPSGMLGTPLRPRPMADEIVAPETEPATPGSAAARPASASVPDRSPANGGAKTGSPKHSSSQRRRTARRHAVNPPASANPRARAIDAWDTRLYGGRN